MKLAKIRDVKTPTRGTTGSAGIDFYIPDDVLLPPFGTIEPGGSVMIPSGIKADVPEGYALIAFNKSGIATKRGLQVGACVVDSDYQGEIHVHLTNVSDRATSINNGDKIVQFLLIPVSHCPVTIVSESELYSGITERGDGGFGSTGTV